ncbi:uncharacterized protein AKAW2_30209S [Aspergillus luchuensis]|uniref:Uncharacterized protein n=1 Tax=Aspergillus kawachii TaxID=1069201 RepID=A0A7R7ZWA7_ASPKA|nr:uncharacterized protein AKAW2_30209S [Aspergillus luchuensis]BCR96890.1 hypothetical protein AKAW2_30209S [Aspergillus luchuensis]BCS09377.1 hypothetical protein ALUC_30194S [Aspergillus luchuensis]
MKVSAVLFAVLFSAFVAATSEHDPAAKVGASIGKRTEADAASLCDDLGVLDC